MTNPTRTKTSPPVQQPDRQTSPYSPSFIDRLLQFFERLPGPYWLPLVALFLLQSFLIHILAWVFGWLPAYTFNPIGFLFPAWMWIPLGIMIYLNRVSLEALASFRPLLDLGETELESLKREFTTMPPRAAFLSGFFWVVIYIIQSYLSYDVYTDLGIRGALQVVIFLEGLVSYAVGSAIYYHSFRQLVLVNRTVKLARPFNLFQLDPVYAFSRLTARTGVAWMVMLSLTLLLFPVAISNAPVVAILGLQLVLALAAFFLPLKLVNDRLVAEKRRLLGEFNRRVESTLERMHRSLERNDLTEMAQFESALTALAAEREVLNKIPTWPWRPGTLTSFLSAVGLPILLFLLQMMIGNWFGE